MVSPRRTVLFVDYQNMYRSARDAFGWRSAPAHFGNFRPLALGLHLTRDPRCRLSQIRVYIGIHTPRRAPELNAMMQRRMSAWVAESPDIAEVFPRPPALQFVADRFPGKQIITLGYKEKPGYENDAPAPLDLPRGRVERRLINDDQFDPMIDRRNFFQPQSDESKRIDADRWARIRRRYGDA